MDDVDEGSRWEKQAPILIEKPVKTTRVWRRSDNAR
jgi:hypothetical protein